MTHVNGWLTKHIALAEEGNFDSRLLPLYPNHSNAFCEIRFDDAIQTAKECPIPCHKRRGCSACLGEPGRCTWCEETQTCFVFSVYTGKRALSESSNGFLSYLPRPILLRLSEAGSVSCQFSLRG